MWTDKQEINPMEVVGGKHCGLEECKQYDFLPFFCETCGIDYCCKHRGRASHGCEQIMSRREAAKPPVVAPVFTGDEKICPKCKQPVLGTGSDWWVG